MKWGRSLSLGCLLALVVLVGTAAASDELTRPVEGRFRSPCRTRAWSDWVVDPVISCSLFTVFGATAISSALPSGRGGGVAKARRFPLSPGSHRLGDREPSTVTAAAGGGEHGSTALGPRTAA